MVDVLKDNDVTVIELGPQYDALDAPTVQQAKETMLHQAAVADPPRLVLDLSQTDYIGSTFVEILIRTWKRIQQRNGRMVLCGLTPFCDEVLRVMRLDTLWDIYPDRASAVAAAK